MARRFACSPVAARKVRVSCSNNLDRLAGVGELTLVARDNEIVRLRLLAQRRVLLDESMGTLGLAPDLALELGGVRLLLAEVAADRGGSRRAPPPAPSSARAARCCARSGRRAGPGA